MVYNCPCGTSISIPTWMFFQSNASEMAFLCLQYDYVTSSGNPWFDSVLTKGESGDYEEEAVDEEDETEEERVKNNELVNYIEDRGYIEDNLEGHYEAPDYYEETDQDR